MTCVSLRTKPTSELDVFAMNSSQTKPRPACVSSCLEYPPGIGMVEWEVESPVVFHDRLFVLASLEIVKATASFTNSMREAQFQVGSVSKFTILWLCFAIVAVKECYDSPSEAHVSRLPYFLPSDLGQLA